MRNNSYAVILLICVIMAIHSTEDARAFSEDVCQNYSVAGDTSKVETAEFNCNDLQGRDGEGGLLTGMATYFRTLQGEYYARSSLHFDLVWLLARLNDLTKEDAMTVAAYSEGTDLGAFTPYFNDGAMNANHATENITGVTRTSMDTVGFWIHYVPWMKLSKSSSNKNPLTYNINSGKASPFGPSEGPLNHLRSWAFGERNSLCTFGLTDTGGKCFGESGAISGLLHLSAPLAGPVRTAADITLGTQKVKLDDDSYAVQIAGKTQSLGIYLHAMIDRLSHHFCSDISPIKKKGSGEYDLTYALTCGQGIHAVLHYREAGHSPLPERTKKAVDYLNYEINSWVKNTKYTKQSLARKADKGIIQKIYKALEQSKASDRVAALKAIASDNSLGWHDQP